MRPEQFFQALKKNGPAPVYLFYGKELHLQNKAVRSIVTIVPEGQRDFNFDRFDGAEANLADVLTVARTLPFMAPKRVVLVRDLEKVRLDAEKTSLLTGYLENPSPETVLIATTVETAAARSLSKKVKGLWTEVVFHPLRGGSLTSGVRETAREKGVRITAEGIERLIEAAGSDLARINQELEKLSLAVGPGGEIGAPEVHTLVCGYTFQTAFDLVQAICDRNLRRSLTLIDRLFEAGSDTAGLMGMLAKRLRILWYLTETAPGRAGAAVPPSFRLQKWQLKDFERQAAGFSRREIEGLLDALLRIDRLVKSSPASLRLLLERLVLNLGTSAPALSPFEQTR
jgi:DNA polymerase-3 subunit delta